MMKNNPVNPKKLKKGVIYKYTARITGIEYWEFLNSYVTNDVWRETKYRFRQIYGTHFRNETIDTFSSIDISIYTFYTNKEDRKFLNRKMKK